MNKPEKKLNCFDKNTLPLLPLKDLVVFPYMVIPLFIERAQSINALEEAINLKSLIFIATQRDPGTEKPKLEDLYSVGTIAKVIQIYKLPDDTIKILIEGLNRAKIIKLEEGDSFLKTKLEKIKVKNDKNLKIEALIRLAINKFEQYLKLNNDKFQSEIMISLGNIKKPDKLADIISSNLILNLKEKQNLLEIFDPLERLEKLIGILKREITILKLEKKIQNRVEVNLEKFQKDYYLKEQLKEIQKELGDKEINISEADEFKEKILSLKLDKELEDKLIKETIHLEKIPILSAESGIIINYLEWILALPWNKKYKEKLDIKLVKKTLDEDHYGLLDVKERILEYLAVRKLSNKKKGVILCLIGPPGVGKTSLAKSIARAMDRKFVRASLGGVRDEAEIRGHRRTYIGSMPGRIIQGIVNAKSKNPVFLLDEIDKISMDFRSDPAAALLEVLDPEQNNSFSDHYLEIPFDLSEVMFITTANNEEEIPYSLRDRMEIINIPGYTDYEKIKIGQLFLIPKQLNNHGFKKREIEISEKAIKKIIREYTHEAGVRGLEKEIASICRKVALKIVSSEKKKTIRITLNNLENYLGISRYKNNEIEKEDMVGLATGLAWTEAGGEVLSVETIVMPGKGKLTLTGQLGDVMQESGKAALTYARSRAAKFKIDNKFYENCDIHVHIPEGAIPKDGPSAGITMATSLISSLTEIPVRKDIAMTGEITLRGRVLPVGGLKEKILAAYQYGIKTIIIPRDNIKNLEDLPNNIKKGLKFIAVNNVDEVLKIALTRYPF
ncbi:MAG: endopeptidase La [Candidatus Infernicultor aquiphilus]|uniref:Lon protease n=1 Tax=Candidatus Infernicultor aquiphilus TaxID=1805029 RepID=A0A1J5GCS4_9BACT|nr:endopeptidase La [bacterium]OIP70067.1 MAG: endopeptidase La [Candidatus Atribacteria bacterium CG2_30_33_13]PIU24949.1 MAG: endopeptidase La [Candidatus Atribacteria bacterium CG08_land_8_20_14_0_20_33_29]PIX33862.1 MAG: endopeptidase La [Candidatus Atribacteria bacterium CG_4_8_14_3_um_filter_34_18]PIY33739.1 MAG: endopeptidase La [Candidatus Atribacteria bacterium CG_4_10_14_3_um_filter_34_13]PJB56376.1 MAG: endopeptidase La [Candidatus Atribacteria bacterium CG_4_9_14_3_um_filter_33_16]